MQISILAKLILLFILYCISNISIKNHINFIGYNNTYSFHIKRKYSVLHQCPICYNNRNSVGRFNCIHECCVTCINNWINTCQSYNRNVTCPICRAELLS